MSTALDLAALAAQGELKIPIARGVVSQGGSGTDYTGWDGVSSVFVEAKVEVREQSRGFATLTLTVEGSSNGSDWSTLETFTFGSGGTQSASVSAPPNHLRVSWAVGGHSEWQIIEVTAAPSIIDTGGGSQTYASRGQYVGNNVSIAPPDILGAGGSDYLTWDSLLTGAAVLDISTPNAPVVVAAGIYAVGVVIQAADAAGARNFEGILHLDGENDDAVDQDTMVFDHTAFSFPANMGLKSTWNIPAGGSIRLQVFNEGDNTVNYKLLEAMVQLLPGGP